MKKSTKSKTPAAPQVEKTASPKAKTVGTKSAAKKTASAPAKKAAAPKKAAASKKVATAAPVPAKAEVKAPAKKAAPKKVVPAKKPVVSAPVKTVITAKIDVGFGNALHLRGEGPGLSWETGALMNCANDDEWTFTIADASAPLVVKFLINDESWSTGEDFVVAAGSSVVLEPTF